MGENYQGQPYPQQIYQAQPQYTNAPPYPQQNVYPPPPYQYQSAGPPYPSPVVSGAPGGAYGYPPPGTQVVYVKEVAHPAQGNGSAAEDCCLGALCAMLCCCCLNMN